MPVCGPRRNYNRFATLYRPAGHSGCLAASHHDQLAPVTHGSRRGDGAYSEAGKRMEVREGNSRHFPPSPERGHCADKKGEPP